MHEYISRLEKFFLLSLVQNAKCQHITRPENLEFLGEFAGGAKITRTEKAKEKNGKDSYRSLQWRKKKKIQIVEDNYKWLLHIKNQVFTANLSIYACMLQ